MVQLPSRLHEVGEYVSGTGEVFASIHSCSKLTDWGKKVDVICSHEVLSHVDDSHLQTGFTVMICRVLCYISGKLSDLDIVR